MRVAFDLRGKVWKHPGAGGWHFVTLPATTGREIREAFGGGPGWGSVKVVVHVRDTSWATSIFPDQKSGSYLLPLKADVRKAHGLVDGKAIRYRIVIEG